MTRIVEPPGADVPDAPQKHTPVVRPQLGALFVDDRRCRRRGVPCVSNATAGLAALLVVPEISAGPALIAFAVIQQSLLGFAIGESRSKSPGEALSFRD